MLNAGVVNPEEEPSLKKRLSKGVSRELNYLKEK